MPVQPSQGIATFLVRVPVEVAPAASAGLKPTDFSANTQSLNYWVYQSSNGHQAAAGTLANLTPHSSQCTTNASGTICTISFTLAPGSYYCSVVTYSQTNGHGPVLSIQEFIPLTVSSSGAVTTPPWTLWGVPHTIDVSPAMTTLLRRTGSVLNDYGKAPISYSVVAYDQSGAVIVGPGIPAWTVTSTNGAFAISQPTAQAPSSFTVTPAAAAGPITTQLSITGSFPASRVNFCRVVGANCSANLGTLNALDVQNDDWITFAHDYQRTGYEKQFAGLSTTTAPKLALRWKVQVSGGAIQANPAVYDGNVIVVTSYPAIAYDLSAIDGSIIWQRSLAAASLKPATIDPAGGAHGLVFVGDRVLSNTVSPSTLYALNLNDGSIAWQTTLIGATRSPEVVANGNVYVGTAGGDPPQCLNNGVEQINESTGAVGWIWYVNTLKNPGGGGAVWGPLSYDGAHLIFGTGNVCQTSGTTSGAVTTADGAAALSLTGKLLWTFVAWAQTGSNAVNMDYDTGSSVMIQNAGQSTETATFLNKNSSLYTFNTGGLSSSPSSAVLQRNLVVNPYHGQGFYTSPTSDGTYTVVQTGAYSNASSSSTGRSAQSTGQGPSPDVFTPKGFRRPARTISGYHSFLQAFDASGNSKWSYEMQTFMAGYAAIANGVVVSQGDSAVNAFAINGNGKPLWSYPTAGIVDSSPAIVPSGIYITDDNGNVYAFAPPYATSNPLASSTAGHDVGSVDLRP